MEETTPYQRKQYISEERKKAEDREREGAREKYRKEEREERRDGREGGREERRKEGKQEEKANLILFLLIHFAQSKEIGPLNVLSVILITNSNNSKGLTFRAL